MGARNALSVSGEIAKIDDLAPAKDTVTAVSGAPQMFGTDDEPCVAVQDTTVEDSTHDVESASEAQYIKEAEVEQLQKEEPSEPSEDSTQDMESDDEAHPGEEAQ